MVRAEFPSATLIRLPRNRGAVARNIGVRHAATPYVAFSDDDSWWAQGALHLAELAFERCPRLAVVAARTLVGPEEREDPEAAAMAESPLGRPPDLPGPAVLGFVACAAVVRRRAFLAAGGFSRVLLFPGEESLLAWDLAAAGWRMSYVDHVVAHHHPSTRRPQSTRRRALELRNALLTTLMRRPMQVALAHTRAVVRQAMREPAARRGLAGALRRLPAALAERQRLPAGVERQLALLEAAQA
jgi:GT2 family glycosyltransferase